MQPTFRDEIKWSLVRQVAPEVHFNVVVARYTLVLSSSEGVQVVAVKIADNGSYVGTGIIRRRNDLIEKDLKR